MSFKKFKIKVLGEKIVVDVDEELDIVDINNDMAQVASKIAYWGAIWASAEGELISSEAFYRNWRAKLGKTLSAADSKMTEWKIKQEIESDPTFLKIKQGMAQAQKNVTTAKMMCEAFRSKASMLQSKGAMQRAELDATSMRTPSKKPVDSGQQEQKRREYKDQLKATLKKRK